jgi:hypothetical protein
MSARKKELMLLARNESSTSTHEKIAKLNRLFAPKREERRILSSPPHILPRPTLTTTTTQPELPQLHGETRGEP